MGIKIIFLFKKMDMHLETSQDSSKITQYRITHRNATPYKRENVTQHSVTSDDIPF